MLLQAHCCKLGNAKADSEKRVISEPVEMSEPALPKST